MHWTKRMAAGALTLSLGVALAARGQATPASDNKASLSNWWKNAVILEIYPRSFQDSNGDGIGDLNGITQRLDYLKSLGVDAIWLTPIYPSPQVDFGYDISDYEGIDPQYGTMADFDKLMAEANKRNIRVIMDMVMNHSSDKHKWFMESRSSKKNPYRDWYVWKDGKGETATSQGEVPNNWRSDFGGSAWEWDPTTRQYWYHKFYTEQPDFNWNNPKVHQAFKDIIAFWLKKGVAGFRFDAITTLFEDPQWHDEDPVLDKNGQPVKGPDGEVELQEARTNNLPEVHDVMKEMRASADKGFKPMTYPGTRVFIGETYLPNIGELAKQYGTADRPEFHLPMDTQILGINKMDAVAFRSKLNDVETGIGNNVPLLVFDNHDNPRIDARYGDGTHNEDIERVLATVLFASKGTSLFYYGDEIGMKTTPPERKEDVKDPVGRRYWPAYKGRDGERTPMQWDDSANAGFTTGTPWLPVPPTYKTVNVKAEDGKPDSMLTWYQKLIELKKTNAAMGQQGTNLMLDQNNSKVLSWLRQTPDGKQVLVSCNFSADPQTVNLSGGGVKGTKATTLLKSPSGSEPSSLDAVQLPAFGVWIGEVQ
ncbi:glycoside hydrolase family 13 protein [Occallatibacter riparius]|uniref:Alpha-glucosidase n=1 Tax=Occallatibacter riparius TaxID=1002689 RepID=A0A9J7BVF8_9BACT|nr:alpha-glucosidase [Occallatibacter riparius]UWZ84886.1 alpha-glucosidase [Occallatibacter riparius]